MSFTSQPTWHWISERQWVALYCNREQGGLTSASAIIMLRTRQRSHATRILKRMGLFRLLYGPRRIAEWHATSNGNVKRRCSKDSGSWSRRSLNSSEARRTKTQKLLPWLIQHGMLIWPFWLTWHNTWMIWIWSCKAKISSFVNLQITSQRSGQSCSCSGSKQHRGTLCTFLLCSHSYRRIGTLTQTFTLES